MNTEKFMGEINYNNVSEQVNIVLASLKWENERCILISIENISQEEKLNRLNQINKFTNKILINISHDIRIPLNTTAYLIDQIKNNEQNLAAENALESDLPDKDSLQVIRSNSKIAVNRLNDIMNYYQLQFGDISLSLEFFNIFELVQEIEEIISIIARMKNIKFSIENSTLTFSNGFINSDKQKILQIILNLITNSLKFASNGNITLKIKMKDNNLTFFEVQDTGCGISNELLILLQGQFELKELSNETYGLGLGLYISKQMLHQLSPQTNFNIKSQKNQGSSFSFVIYTDLTQANLSRKFSLQKVTEQASDFVSEAEPPQLLNKIFQTKSSILTFNKIPVNNVQHQILIVDDQPFNIYVLKMQLLKINSKFSICEAYDGKQAVEIFEKFNNFSKNQVGNFIKVIFMDCQMPIMNGYEATQSIKKNCLKSNLYLTPRIIGYTSLLTPIEQVKCKESGMDCWIQKPASFSQISFLTTKYFEENR